MKRIVYFLLLSLLLVSCGKHSGYFKIDGRLLHINQGELFVYSPEGVIAGLDTIQIKGGRFTYEIPCEFNGTLILVFPNYSTHAIFAEPGEAVEIKADASHLKEMEVKGTDDNELMGKFRKETAVASPPEIVKDAIKFVKEHLDSPVSVYLTERYLINDKKANYKQIAELIEEIQKKLDQQEERKATDNGINLSNGLLNKKYHKIIHNELHSIDTSVETLDILKLIVSNTNAMLNHGINLDSIIRLGQYLRKKGDKVDFLKLEGWLSSLHLQRMAQLQGSILIAVFGFEKDEIDFVKKEEPIAYKLTIKIISNLVKDTAGEWHFRQNSAGFVQNNGKMLRRNLRRSYKYINYAPLETTSNFINGFIRGLSEIEE